MDVVVQHAPRFDARSAQAVAGDSYDAWGSVVQLPSERDQNFRVETDRGTFVLRIANARERRANLELENAALDHLASRCPSLAVPRLCRSTSGETIVCAAAPDGREHMVRLVRWVPGSVLAQVKPHGEALLESLGRRLADLDRGFEDFVHPALEREFPWDLCRTPWIEAELQRFDGSPRRALLERVVADFRTIVAPRLGRLRRQAIHGDWNDHNVVVARGQARQDATTKPGTPPAAGDAEVVGVLDFGDLLHGPVIADLAVACAYAMLDKPDPLAAAAAIVRGFHAALPLTDDEREVLLPLIRARLAISTVMAARQSEAAPGNEYLLVSQRSAGELLAVLDAVSAGFAVAVFRHACGLAPCEASSAIAGWLREHTDDLAPVLGRDLRSARVAVLDLSVGSLDVPTPDTVQQLPAFCSHVLRMMAAAGAEVGVGRYDEARLVYVTDLFRHPNNWVEENRTVHLGVDLFCEAGAPVFAPIEGRVHSIGRNASVGDYGPTVVLEHVVDDGRVRFFTLYGHLSEQSLEGMQAGRAMARGERVGWLGDPGVNGGWPPHLHLQVIADMLGRAGEFPGVASPGEREVWLSLCPDANLVSRIPERLLRPARPTTARDLLARRRACTGPNLSVSYRRPITMARGFGQYLFDRDGRRYLDAVNNVPHVGHGHPRVVEAAARQLAVLNTNTRYLHESFVTYAERLRGLMPDGLGVCFLVCSGSEANELALRLARAYTGRRDVVVVDGAYHGNTTSLVEISPYKFDGPGGSGAAEHVHTVEMPDVYRGRHRADDPLAGPRYAAGVARAIERAESSGRAVAAFICESLLSCGGQIVLPDGYLERAYAAVRAAGGVAIADEVQVGFGRVGSHVWGFQTQGVVPDIVTLGKPIGNGFPIGAVLTRPEIAAAFDNGMEYFNTFGGTQAACAVGHAVLDVMRDEDLQRHALQVGTRLKRELAALAADFPVIGDVRGAGLFLGVELVEDRDTLVPAASQADYVVNRLRDRGMLASTDGPLHNVLKLRPPMPFSADDADRCVSLLAEILAEDAARP